jgi:hypothetical protein
MPKGDSFLVALSQPGSESDEENDSPKNKTPEQASEECDGGDMLNSNASLEDDDHLSAPSTEPPWNHNRPKKTNLHRLSNK